MIFQSTRPVRGETAGYRGWDRRTGISIHSPRAGRDVLSRRQPDAGLSISIHSPRAGRDPRSSTESAICSTFQSTRPVRGETFQPQADLQDPAISIHSPRAGRDRHRSGSTGGRQDISIHSPRAGRDRKIPRRNQSACNFNPLAPCGARRAPFLTPSASPRHFNPLAPCGARLMEASHKRMNLRFQSTRPVRGETTGLSAYYSQHPISIHSPRAGRDQARAHPGKLEPISIHSPRAGRDR